MSKIVGTNGRDMIRGTNGNDTIFGLKGNDLIEGRGGNDNVLGGDGHDKLKGGAGHDWLDGGNGDDALFGEDGNDWLFGGAGNDYLNGGAGNDRIEGGAGHDALRGDTGNDTLIGGDGDSYMGGAGNDTLHYSHSGEGDPDGFALFDGGTGIDTLVIDSDQMAIVSDNSVGYYGIDVGTVTSGRMSSIENIRVTDDSFLWHLGSDRSVNVIDGANDSYFTSGSGNETFTGGGGVDQYQFRWSPGTKNGHDTITDFKVGEDVLSSRYADYITGEPILEVVQKETATGTRFQAYDDGHTLVHTLDLVGVFGLEDGALYNPYALFGPLG